MSCRSLSIWAFKVVLMLSWVMMGNRLLRFLSRPVSMTSQMTPHMAQAGPSAGQILTQMSRQNGVTHSVTPSHPCPPASTVAPLQGGTAGGGWPAAGAAARPQFNSQVKSFSIKSTPWCRTLAYLKLQVHI